MQELHIFNLIRLQVYLKIGNKIEKKKYYPVMYNTGFTINYRPWRPELFL